MSNIPDYNIENYNDDELLDILGFSNKINAEIKINKTIDKLRQEKDRGDIIEFLEKAKVRLKGNTEIDTMVDINLNPANSTSRAGIKSHYFKKKLKSVLSLNTLFRRNYFNTKPNDYNVKFPSPFKNVISIKLSSIELFNSWYNVQADIGTNKFSYEISGNSVDVFIASGNPDANSLITQIKEQIIENGHGDVLICTYDFDTTITPNSKNTGRVKFEYSGTGTFSLDFTNTVMDTPIPMISLGWMMGFRNMKYNSGYNAAEDNKITYISESVLNIAGTPYVYVAVEDYQASGNDTVIGVFSDSLLSKKILAKVPINAASNSIIYDDVNRETYKSREYFGPVNIERMKISLLDQYGNLLELNDIDFSLSIEITMLHSL